MLGKTIECNRLKQKRPGPPRRARASIQPATTSPAVKRGYAKNNIKNECVCIHPGLVEIDKPGDRWGVAGG